MGGEKMKICSKCEVPKPLGKYSRNRANKDGLQNQCKDCKIVYARKPGPGFNRVKQAGRKEVSVLRARYQEEIERIRKKETGRDEFFRVTNERKLLALRQKYGSLRSEKNA
jgi:hypothetical protein